MGDKWHEFFGGGFPARVMLARVSRSAKTPGDAVSQRAVDPVIQKRFSIRRCEQKIDQGDYGGFTESSRDRLTDIYQRLRLRSHQSGYKAFWWNCSGRISEIDINMAADRKMTEEERRVEASAHEFLDAHFPQIIQDYIAENGNTLDADRAKEHFEVYAQNRESRIKWGSAMYGPASKLVDTMFETKITETEEEIIVFLGGGPGAGKTSFSTDPQYRDVLKEAAVVMDGTLANYERSATQIRFALDRGHQVVVFFIHRRFDEAIDGVISRACSPQSLRVVPLSVVASKHLGAVETLVRLKEEFARHDSVEIQVAVFRGVGEPFGVATVAEVKEAMTFDIDQLVQKSYQILDGRYQAQQHEGISEGEHQITEAIYQGLRR